MRLQNFKIKFYVELYFLRLSFMRLQNFKIKFYEIIEF